MATDYLGLGKSDYPYHPYLHADSEASAIVDSIRAAQKASAKLASPSTIRSCCSATPKGAMPPWLRSARSNAILAARSTWLPPLQWRGPYDLSQTFLSSWFGYTAGQENVMATELLSYAVISLNRVYGSLYTHTNQVFAEPYADYIENLFSGSLSIDQIEQKKLLPPGAHLNDLRNPEFTADFLLDDKQALRIALKKNDLLDWTPRAATMLCGSHRDAIVDFQNAYAAQASFRRRGADVHVIDIADEIPASASGADHHRSYAFLCYAKARAQLFDPIAQRSGAGANAALTGATQTEYFKRGSATPH